MYKLQKRARDSPDGRTRSESLVRRILERQASVELHQAGSAGALQLAKEAVVQVGDQTAEVGVVEEIEAIQAEAELHALVDGELLADGDVERNRAWIANGVVADVAGADTGARNGVERH